MRKRKVKHFKSTVLGLIVLKDHETPGISVLVGKDMTKFIINRDD